MCAAMLAAVPATAQDARRGIELLPGHPIYHESEQKAGVAMALAITPEHDPATNLTALCEELRLAGGLGEEDGDRRLETIFVVPYKGMAIEGYYWPKNGASGDGVLVAGSSITRDRLDAIVTRVGLPSRVLDETNVEHEISCQTREPLWHLVWHDIRPIGDESPTAVIERAHDRFMEVHQVVLLPRFEATVAWLGAEGFREVRMMNGSPYRLGAFDAQGSEVQLLINPQTGEVDETSYEHPMDK